MDIAEWLRGLGLEQYADAFRENAIDAEVVSELTADDLRELGITPSAQAVGSDCRIALGYPSG
jgi:SAM domain (Sterile alpha motif)